MFRLDQPATRLVESLWRRSIAQPDDSRLLRITLSGMLTGTADPPIRPETERERIVAVLHRHSRMRTHDIEDCSVGITVNGNLTNFINHQGPETDA